MGHVRGVEQAAGNDRTAVKIESPLVEHKKMQGFVGLSSTASNYADYLIFI